MLGSTLRSGAALSCKSLSKRDLSDLLEPVAAELPRVEKALASQVGSFDLRLGDHIRYVLGGNAKRLRPSLALLAGGVTGGIRDEHITLAVIVELIHIATLVHDDILDEAELRHQAPTSNQRFGNEISVLLGDCLFAHALRLAAGYPTTEVCRRVSEATNTVCSGEIVQTQRRFDVDLTLDQYLEIINMKTGALFAVSCELGAVLNGAPPAVVKSMYEYGANLGIAYQIYDDCVDIFGQERQAGKSLGTDMKKGKLTLPFLLLLQHAGAESRQELRAMILRNDLHEQQRLLRLILGNGVVGESLAAIDTYIGRAQQNLSGLPSNVYGNTLASLTEYLSGQSRVLLREAVAA
ncbi:MAG TPA: polyprenyl synthetase family protein [Verrucomicrobiae bacterium]|nr:polyprenyl synthetase family protein [Verrucomicrobiae bacterium]